MSDSSEQGDQSTPRNRVGFSDRVLTEAVRRLEQDGAAIESESTADDAARAAGGDLEQRLIVRARCHSAVEPLEHALGRTRRAMWFIIIGCCGLALLAGAGAASGALSASSVNFYRVLMGLLGVQTLMLALWAVVMVIRPRGAGASILGSLTMGLGRFVATKVQKGPHAIAALGAMTSITSTGAVGRWSLSAISHALWLSFNVGCLALTIFLLSTRLYTFGWETTILPDSAYAKATQVIAYAPARLGFDVPTNEDVAASHLTVAAGQPEGPRQRWSALLVGSLVLYGLGPRLVLLGLSLSGRRSSCRRYRLPIDRPGYQLLTNRLMPDHATVGVVNGTPIALGEDVASAGDEGAEEERNGPPAIMGFEIDPPEAPWPPKLHAVRWMELGFVEHRDDQQRVLLELLRAEPRPNVVCVVCGLTMTPDRGTGSFLRQVGNAGRNRVALILTGGQHLRERSDARGVDDRISDWRELAEHVGISAEDVLELDLDHATDTSLKALSELVGDDGGAGGVSDGRQLEAAFGLIMEAASAWDRSPSHAEQAELHRAIARLHRAQSDSWTQWLGLPTSLTADLPGKLSSGAARMRELMPARLQTNPKWLAAGGLCGAMSCVAAAALLSPAAIASLPLWTAIGAAITLAAPMVTGGSEQKAEGGDDPPVDDGGGAVRSAVLLALLLEAQGHDEAAISRVLDRALPADDGDDAAFITNSAALAPWLDEIRHRFDQAMLAEGAR